MLLLKSSPPTLITAAFLMVVCGTPSILHAQTGAKKPHATAPAKRSPATTLDPLLKEAIANAPDASKYSDSDAMLLLDISNVTVQADGTTVADIHQAYKLFNKRGRDLAEVRVPYNSAYQYAKLISAKTITRSGQVRPVNPNDTRLTSSYTDYALYDDSVALGFSMPAVEDNCVIDYSYRITSIPLLYSQQFWQFWRFNGPRPVGLSRLTITVPTARKTTAKVYNNDSLKPTIRESSDKLTTTYVWEMRNQAPLVSEVDMPTYRDVSIWMEISSLASWQDVAQWYWKLMKPQAVSTKWIKASVDKLIAGKTTDEEKARAIHGWMIDKVRYVGLEFGLSAFQPHAAAEVHSNLYGDCKDKATLLITMLANAGIKAHPVLLHTTDRRVQRDKLPVPTSFNHCIALAEVGGKEIWLDPTDESCPYGDIPYADRGADAFVIRNGVGEFKTIPPYTSAENVVMTTLKVHLNPDGSAKANIALTLRGVLAQGIAEAFRVSSSEQRTEIMRMFARRLAQDAVLKDYTPKEIKEPRTDIELQMDITSAGFAHKSGDLLLVPACYYSNPTSTANPYGKETRVHPIVFKLAITGGFSTTFELPDGYRLLETPKDSAVEMGPFHYKRTVASDPTGRTLTVSGVSTLDEGRVEQKDYPQLRLAFEKTVRDIEEQIVLKREK